MWLLLSLAACFEDVPADKARDSGDTGAPADDSGDPVWWDSSPEVETGCQADEDDDGWCGDTATPADCDDDDPDVYPGAEEVCNGTDDDCDDAIDEDVSATYYRDDDGDGYGDADHPQDGCGSSDGWSADNTDCDDADPDVNPGAGDPENGQDDDCDGLTDEGGTTFSVTVDWDASGVTFTIAGGTTAGWELGMAETGAGSAGWFGESCIGGSEPWGYDDYGFDVCHDLVAAGGDVPSVYPDVGSVENGATLFNEDIGDRGDITYVLFDTASSACWVFGDDPSYYDDYGCTEY